VSPRKEILIEEIVMKTFLTVVIGVILTSALAMAEQKLFLSYTNGRDPQTNAANIVEPNISVVIDREAKTFAPYDPRWTLPIERLDDQTITARMRTNVDLQMCRCGVSTMTTMTATKEIIRKLKPLLPAEDFTPRMIYDIQYWIDRRAKGWHLRATSSDRRP
jgi:hypothetical protein